MSDSLTRLRVPSGEVTLAVTEHSPAGPGRPTVVLVHGYPDQQDTWDAVVARLPLAEWHIVTYDVRGAGGSTAPAGREGYRSERLVDDLVAVLEAVRPEGGPAHLVGHDWGSVQLWDVVAAEGTDPRLQGRIASFTSISGPSMDHTAWILRHREGREDAVRRQQLHSSYIALFCTPVVPTLLWRFGHRPIGALMSWREGLPRGHWGRELGRNAVNGLELYRANIPHRMSHPGSFHTDVPVLVVHPERDRFLTEVLTEDLDRVCSDVRVERLDAPHWVILTRADDVAALVTEHVSTHLRD
jgi:pimeloyl-ACP methyl ester carboxylesterase